MANIFYDQITLFGGLIFYVFVLGLCLILNLMFLFNNLLISLILVMLLSTLIKYFYLKERPKKQKKDSLLQRLDASSFPSVHTMRAFSLAFWFSMFYSNTIITIYILIIALLVIYSRIYLKKHYLTDVIIGLIFSVIINLIIWWYL
jgi:undecaprenyl-diphosphatase|tara:strand:- start:1573 stop:2010 length:438 start_codon:yes stop_codon:yes gene_type:complete